jgi:hypothetical protein
MTSESFYIIGDYDLSQVSSLMETFYFNHWIYFEGLGWQRPRSKWATAWTKERQI